MKNKFSLRIDKIREMFFENKIDGLYISKPADVSYFTGTKGRDISLWIDENQAVLITDFRYREMAKALNWFSYSEEKPFEVINQSNVKRVGVCRNSLPLDLYISFSKELKNKQIVITGDSEYNLVNQLRMIKDSEEIEFTKKAQDIGCLAFEYIIKHIKPGLSEKQIAVDLEYFMLNNGADGISFDTICVSGKKTSMPHGVPDEKQIEIGDFVTLDYGCTYRGYHSDMTRTIAVGKASDEMKHVYETVLKAQINACNKIKAGLSGDICHTFAFDIIEKAGYGEYFGHGLGHGTGLEIHEAPRFSPFYKGIIPENSIVSIEPGIYIPGKFGVRIEDLAVIKENGIINITSAPKELIII